MGVYAFDGQVDDVTGGDAGAELEFGDELRGEPAAGAPAVADRNRTTRRWRGFERADERRAGR